jgi:hypothetical protein
VKGDHLICKLSVYLGRCGNSVLFFMSLNCLCRLVCVCQLKACVVMETYLVFRVFL